MKVYGWLQNSFTYNADGRGPTGTNFGVNPNYLADRWMGNQYYLIIENPLEQNDRINFGFRVDNLFGNDWVFNHMRGLNEHSFRLNHFLGYDPAQIYGEVHLPWLTKGGIDVKGGRFYTILGYEVVPAIGRPLLSVPYMFNYGQPFTHLGMLSTLHLTDRINIYNGTVNGYDRWFNADYKWNYLGGWTWTSKDTKANFAISYIWGPNQYPRFLSGTNQQVFLLGNTIPPHEDGRRNLGYGGNNRLSFTNVFTYKWTDKLTQVEEVDLSFENNIPGSGGVPLPNGAFSGGTDRNDSWSGLGQLVPLRLQRQADRRLAVGSLPRRRRPAHRVPRHLLRADHRHDLEAQALHLDPARGAVRLVAVHPPLRRRHPEEPVHARHRRDPALLTGGVLRGKC